MSTHMLEVNGRQLLARDSGHVSNSSDWFTVTGVCLVVWLTVFATFTLPGRGHLAAGEIDMVAKIKIASRLFSIMLLGWLVFAELRKEYVLAIVTRYWLWGLFVGWAILSTLWSPLRATSLGQAAGQLLLMLLSMSIAICSRRRANIDRIAFHSLVAIGFYCLIYGVGGLFIGNAETLSRSSENQFVHPTALAAAAGLGCLLATCLITMSNNMNLKAASLLVLPVLLIALIAAHNRTSLLITPVLCVLVIVVRGKSHLLAAGSLVIAFCGTLYLTVDPGFVAVEQALGSSVQFLERGQSTSEITELSGRAEMWSKMWKSYLEAPLIGHGYMVCSASGTLYVWYSEMNHTAHNVVLQALVSTGFIGATIYILWNLNVLVMLGSCVRYARNDSLVPVTVVAVGVWFAIWCMLNESMLGPVRPESVVYALAVGLVVGQFHFYRTNTDSNSASSVMEENK